MYKTPFSKSKFSLTTNTSNRRINNRRNERSSEKTSWHKEASDYNKIVGEDGHYYHQHVVIPNVVKLLNLKSEDSVLDLGCGQGVLGRAIPSNIKYVGVDNAHDLIRFAQKMNKSSTHEYVTASATRPLQLNKQFTRATIILALQNMDMPDRAIENASRLMKSNGKLVIVLNHPMFRIPRQSGWGEHSNKIQYRYINRYLSPLKIPILMHPSQKNSASTMSFHFPLSSYAKWLNKYGFLIEDLQEWTSDKVSEGRSAKAENRARSEFPLFMTIIAIKR